MTVLADDGRIRSGDDAPARPRPWARAVTTARTRMYPAVLSAVVVPVSLASGLAFGSVPTRIVAADEWPTYLSGVSRAGFDPAESVITASSVRSLRQRWMASAAGAVSAEPVVADGVVYWGSWDGYERATTSRGRLLWTVFLGTTAGARCDPSAAGVASTATVATVLTGRTLTRAVFVGGGDGYFYALNARNGAVIWKTLLGVVPGGFLWSSPAYYDGSIYEGVASFGDCPLVRGELVRLNAVTGAVQDIFYTVPAGCTGAGVWGSPTIDADRGDVYFATGNARSCALPQPMATAVVEVTASALALVGYWRVPPSEHGVDSDFGSTPTLFTATIGGVTRPLVGVQNKNGVYYAFSRADIAAGPVWQRRIANPGQCPECGRGDISPSAWDGQRLYIGGGNTTVNGTECRGTLRAASPVTGKMIWLRCLNSGAVLAAVTAVRGLVFAGTGIRLLAVSARTGRTLYQYKDATPGSDFWGAASISGGVLYAGNQDGHLYALSP
jgi:outer membrane protein assembly factor BamB